MGLGVACVDMIATVEQYPKPDDKIRAIDVDLFSGGNIGNTLTAINKLGAADTKVVTKIGDDSNGAFVLHDFAAAGVDTSDVVVASTGAPTLLVYVIADKSTATRTCIAAPPKEELEVHEVLGKLDVLQGAALLHLDSRHTAAAVAMATEANRRGVPVAVDVEKDRPPHLRALLPLCNLVFTNQTFPLAFFGTGDGSSEDRGDCDVDDDMLRTLRSMTQFFGPNSRTSVVVTTRGEHGALLVRKRRPLMVDPPPLPLPPLSTLCGECALDRQLVSALHSSLHIDHYHYIRTGSDLKLRYASPVAHEDDADAVYDVLRCSAWPLLPGDLVDSTGAGDAFIGGFLSAWVMGLSDADCMGLASAVAAAKLGAKGAKTGLPTANEVNRRIGELQRRQDDVKRHL